MEKIYNAAIYLRLSREDGLLQANGESNSIVSQKEIILSYLGKHREIQLYDIYADDGDIIGRKRNWRITCLLSRNSIDYGFPED